MSNTTTVRRISNKVLKQGCEAIAALDYASRIRGDDPEVATINILRNEGYNVKMQEAIAAAVERGASEERRREVVRQMVEAYLAQ